MANYPQERAQDAVAIYIYIANIQTLVTLGTISNHGDISSHSRHKCMYVCICTYVRLYVKCLLYSCDFNRTAIFSPHFSSNNLQHEISRKSVVLKPSRSKWTDGQTDRQTDMAELTVTVSNSENAFYVGEVRIWCGLIWIETRASSVLL